MGLEAADVGDEIVDFLPRERKIAHAAVGFGEEGCEPVVGPANVAGDSRQWRGRVPRPTAVDEMALGAPAAGDILARNRVTRRLDRAVRINQGAAQRDHRTDAVTRPPHDRPSVNDGSLLGEAGLGWRSDSRRRFCVLLASSTYGCGDLAGVKYVKNNFFAGRRLHLQRKRPQSETEEMARADCQPARPGKCRQQCLSGMSKKCVHPLPDSEWEVIVYATRKDRQDV